MARRSASPSPPSFEAHSLPSLCSGAGQGRGCPWLTHGNHEHTWEDRENPGMAKLKGGCIRAMRDWLLSEDEYGQRRGSCNSPFFGCKPSISPRRR